MKSPDDYDENSEAIIFVSWALTIAIGVVLGVVWLIKHYWK